MHFTPHALALLFTAGLAAALALVAWQRRAMPGGTWFALLMLASAEWAFMSALEKAVPTLAAKILCAKIEYLGIGSVPALWLMFAVGYSQQAGWLTRRNGLVLWIMPCITVILAVTNEWHRLIWTSITPASPGADALLIYDHGTWFWIFAAYNYGLIFVGTLALARALLRSSPVYRGQTVALLTGLAIPWVSNAVYLAGWSPLRGLDLTPFAFTLTGLACAWGMFRFQLFDLVPVARDTVIESMGDGVVVLDAQDRIADINPAAQQMIGLTQGSPVGQHLATALATWPDIATQLGHAGEIRLGAVYLDIRSAPLHDPRGRTSGRVLLLRDVTDRKLLDELRDDLTHALVHDLRNPLASIKGALEAAAEEAPVQQEMLQIARANAQRMLGLVDSILDVSRLEGGQLPLERRRVHLAALVAEAVQLQHPLAAEKQLRLESEVPQDLPVLFVDARLIVRVLHNLIDNAIKFTPNGGAIHISAQLAPSQRQLAVSVGDTGPGIAPSLRPRVFQKFVAGREAGHGSGLGLAFCRLAVEAHGGRIGMEGDTTCGTTITFTLPVAH
ncbi:MAG TPA: histidine kinase N-terminal 7TM domain-containing protein [Candidatus Margulisiibacteriota bacterium]|nr:histidine kinase N-terminal 7TM domain-containing protein [Candidatus Margulisiibacteriota bacterium]